MTKWISRLDKAIRETGRKKSLFVTCTVNEFNTGRHDILSPHELIKAETIIHTKHVDPYLFAQCHWSIGFEGGVKKYNISIGNVWRCLSKTQWKQLETYYRSLVRIEEE